MVLLMNRLPGNAAALYDSPQYDNVTALGDFENILQSDASENQPQINDIPSQKGKSYKKSCDS